MTSERHELTRDAQPPLAFTGTLLVEASGQYLHTSEDQPNSDWWRVALYRVDGAPTRYVVAIEYHSQYRGRALAQYQAHATDAPAALLSQYRPLEQLRGFPPGPQYEGRQAHLERLSQQQWNTLVSGVLKSFPEEIRHE